MKILSPIILLPAYMLLGMNTIDARAEFSQRFERIKLQAAAGEKRSQYKLALSYLRGIDIAPDLNEAIYWFEKSARQGYANAAHKLGMIYYFSKTGKKRYKKALFWFSQAAKKNHAESQYYLGKLYFEGKGVKQDYERSLFWLKRAESLDFLAATRDIRNIRQILRKSGRAPARRRPTTNITTVAATSSGNAAKRSSATTSRTMGVGGPFHPIAKITTPASALPAKTFKTSEVLLSGFWKKNGNPAEHMPSALNKCTFSQDMMTCITKRLNVQTKVAQISYKVQARFLNFQPNGTFDVKFRKKYLFVLPLDADDPDLNVDLPATGWQRDVNQMKCRIVSTAQISCKKKKGGIIEKFHK